MSPYNDTDVIAGQATLGRELDAQLAGAPSPSSARWAAAGASGLGLWAAGRREATVVGVEAARSPAFTAALAAGAIAPIEPGETLADGLGGNLEPGSATFPLVRDRVAAVVTVSEPEIEEAIRFLARAHGVVAEGAGAVAAAGALAGRVPRGGGGARGRGLRAQHRAGATRGGCSRRGV